LSKAAPRVIIVAGPTAAGKSALALVIAEEFKGVLINADSQQRYADLRILTARPSEADEARVPHKLFGDLKASDSGSAAEWAVKAAAEIQAATADGRLPILVGGTGLYFRALMEGLSDMPAVPEETRAAAKILRDDIGPEAFHTRLAERDPASAARLNAGDSQRMLRAWEVIEATGKPLSAWQQTPGTPPLEAGYFSIVVLPPRDRLYAACDSRFQDMVDGGAMKEVQALLAQGVSLESGAGKALGVSDLAAVLRGQQGLEEAVTLAQTATRQYAKRQMTWFRNQFNASLTLNEKLSESLLREIFSYIRRFLLT
jgi:tRNA dimethylallyltransferase